MSRGEERAQALRRVTQRLEDMNRRFYERYASQFDGTRMSGWAGWAELIRSLPRDQAHRVLDLGCGNGRLARVLGRAQVEDEQLKVERYLGLDRCLALLEAARAHEQIEPCGLSCRWREWSWEGLEPSMPLVAPSRESLGWSWVTLFGVTHHVFSFERRLALLCSAAAQLAPGGHLSVSFWDFGASDRWEGKRAPWSSLAPEWGDDLQLIEEGDALLGWGGSHETPRYCHWVSPQEEGLLSEALCAHFQGALTPLPPLRDPKGHNRYRSWVSAL